jgi:hypothetical protein
MQAASNDVSQRFVSKSFPIHKTKSLRSNRISSRNYLDEQITNKTMLILEICFATCLFCRYLLGDNIATIKKNTETLIDATKELGLEVNTEKTKCML